MVVCWGVGAQIVGLVAVAWLIGDTNAHKIPAYNAIMERMKARGLSVNLHVLDNEASAA